ncbi:hypothetical protein BDZ89DRAFT_1049684 [Hymenopellis radicata]|nr:hypothetical protein BDZ89DRAFT_1049684 [Hymenopellis radicata]
MTQRGKKGPFRRTIMNITRNANDSPPLARARAVLKEFSDYIGPSHDKFVAHAMEMIRRDYRPGESSPILDDIEQRIAGWEQMIHGILNELLNTVGAWGAEYLEVQGIQEVFQTVGRRINDIHVAHLEATLKFL